MARITMCKSALLTTDKSAILLEMRDLQANRLSLPIFFPQKWEVNLNDLFAGGFAKN